MKGSPSEWRRKDQMVPESQNKLLARRFMEEVVNGGVNRLSELLAPELRGTPS